MTSKTERIFTWVWRINGLIVLSIATLALIAIGFSVWNAGVNTSRDRPQDQIAQVAGTDLVTEALKLDRFSAIAGTDYLYARLAAPSRPLGSGSSDGLGTARNLLFFDTISKNAHWLFDDNENDILSWRMVYNEPRRNMTDEKESRLFVVGMILQIAKHEEEPSPGRSSDLVFVSADGRAISPLADSIDSQLGHYHTAPETVLVFYVRDGSVNVLDVDTLNAVVRSDSPLSVGD